MAPEGVQTGAFVAARWRVTDAVTSEVGLRWDNQTYDQVDGGTQLGPRVNLLYDLSPETQVRASWGRFFQAQGISELQVEDGIDTFFPAQRADHFILSLEHAFDGRISARVEAYYKDYEELKPRFENLFDPLVVLPELQTDRVEVAPTAGLVRRRRVPGPGPLRTSPGAGGSATPGPGRRKPSTAPTFPGAGTSGTPSMAVSAGPRAPGTCPRGHLAHAAGPRRRSA